MGWAALIVSLHNFRFDLYIYGFFLLQRRCSKTFVLARCYLIFLFLVSDFVWVGFSYSCLLAMLEFFYVWWNDWSCPPLVWWKTYMGSSLSFKMFVSSVLALYLLHVVCVCCMLNRDSYIYIYVCVCVFLGRVIWLEWNITSSYWNPFLFLPLLGEKQAVTIVCTITYKAYNAYILYNNISTNVRNEIIGTYSVVKQRHDHLMNLNIA